MTELDPVIHPQGRLRVMAVLDALGTQTSITFTRLQELVEMTPGNLITHLRRLEEAGYVATSKAGRKRGTDVTMTARGARAFADYRQALRDMLDG